jgi:hypothetical protein
MVIPRDLAAALLLASGTMPAVAQPAKAALVDSRVNRGLEWSRLTGTRQFQKAGSTGGIGLGPGIHT